MKKLIKYAFIIFSLKLIELLTAAELNNTSEIDSAKSIEKNDTILINNNNSNNINNNGQKRQFENVKINSENSKNFDPLWYLNKFGYLNKKELTTTKKTGSLAMFSSLKSSPNSLSDAIAIENAIKKFQKHANLKVTGKLDKQTIKMMKMPRCGHPDILSESNSLRNFLRNKSLIDFDTNAKRKKRYALQGSKWSRNKLRFRVGKYPKYSMMSRDVINKELKRALELWSEAADVEFDFNTEPTNFGSILLMGQGMQPKLDSNYDIDVRFETGYHGDSEPFDGSGLILGHAYFPEFGGSTHFDADEFWTSKSPSGVNLYQVAVHEFGHALGLEHSENFDAIMAPFFRGYAEDFRLHQDDLIAIEQLYGKSKRLLKNNKLDTTSQENNSVTESANNENLNYYDPNINNNINENSIIDTNTNDINDINDNNLKDNNDNNLKDNNDNNLKDNNDNDDYNTNSNQWTQSIVYTTTTPPTTSKILNTIVPSFTYEPAPSYPIVNQNPDYVESSPLNTLCIDGKFDAISLLSDGFTYIFKDAYVFKINANFVMDPSYPKLISNVFRGWNGITFMSLPNNLDTVLYVPDNDVTYFFKNNLYWRSSKLYQLDPGYPRLVSENFKGLDYDNGFNGKLDASFVWSGNRRVYFVEGDRYWRYDFDLGSIEPGYPKRLSIWRGLPNKISDAFQWVNGITYFFENDRYYRFNDLAFKVEEAMPMYPRLNNEYWFGCNSYSRLGKLMLSPVNVNKSTLTTSTTANEYETIKLDQPILVLNYSIISPTTSKIVSEKDSELDAYASLENSMTNPSHDYVSLVTISAISDKNKIGENRKFVNETGKNNSFKFESTWFSLFFSCFIFILFKC